MLRAAQRPLVGERHGALLVGRRLDRHTEKLDSPWSELETHCICFGRPLLAARLAAMFVQLTPLGAERWALAGRPARSRQGRQPLSTLLQFTTHLPPTPFHLHSATLHPHSTPDRASPTRRWQGAGPATYLVQASAGSPHLCQPSRVGAQPHHVKPVSADL